MHIDSKGKTAASDKSTGAVGGGKEAAWAALILTVAVFVAYWPSLSSNFIRFDDPQYVMENARVQRPTWSGVLRFLTEVRKPSTVAGYYQPLTMISFVLDSLLTGDGVSAGVCHFHNTFLHAVASVLVFLLLRHAAEGFAIPLILALVFAVHPVNVESVAWISQRKTVLATPLALGSLLCYLRHGRSHWVPSVAGQRSPVWRNASIALFLLATLAKPTIVLMPLVLPLLDIWPLGRPVRQNLREKWPFIVVMLVMAYIATVSQAASKAALAVPNLSGLDVLRKWFALLSYNLMLYLGNIFWPLHLSPFRPIPQSLSLADVPILLSELGTVALFVLWLTAWRWSKPFVVGLASFILNLALALGALRFVDSCVADRFLYFPFVFLLLCAAAAIGRIESLSDRPVRLLRYAVLLLLVPLTILMRGQQTIWRDSRTFWTHAAETVPENAVAHLNLGLLSLNEQNPADAFKFAQRAMALRPDDAEVVGLMGRVLIEQGKAADAVKFLDGAVSERLYPDAGPAYLAMGEALVANMDLDRARGAAEKAIELGQPATVVYECLGNMALRKTRRFDFAASCYREAVKAAPENLTARWNIGTALEAAGDMSAALSEYEATLSRQAELGRPSPELVAKVESLRQQRRPAASQKPPDRAVEP